MKLKKLREEQEKGYNIDLVHQCSITHSVYVLMDTTKVYGGDIHVKVLFYYKGPSIDHKVVWNMEVVHKGNDLIAALSFYNGFLNGSIIDPLEGMEFICPSCKGNRLECCEDGYYVSEVTCIDVSGDHDYGNIDASGEVLRWQCKSCGFVLSNNGDDNIEVQEWLKENCG